MCYIEYIAKYLADKYVSSALLRVLCVLAMLTSLASVLDIYMPTRTRFVVHCCVFKQTV